LALSPVQSGPEYRRSFSYINTADQAADYLTKSASKAVLNACNAQLGVRRCGNFAA